jgi:hypothetical protein
MTLPTAQRNALIDLAARIDVLFAPFRCSACNLRAAAGVDVRRYVFNRSGYELMVGGDGATRQQGSRDLQRLEKRGLVEPCGRGKNHGLELTHAGDDLVRQLTGGVLARASFPLLGQIEAVKAEHGSNGGFVNECEIIGVANYDAVTSSQLLALERRALPLLVRGWLDSASDIGGRVGFAVTELGREAVRPAPSPRVAEDPEATRRYQTMFNAGLSARESWRPDREGRLYIPLGAGSWPRGAAAATTEVAVDG